MQHNPTLTEIVSYILRHRKNNSFTYETPEELYEILQAAIHTHCMLVDCDFLGTITGVIVAKEFTEDHRLHIYALLCTNGSSLGKFSRWLLQEAKRHEWTITATRRGRSVVYDTTKLLTKLARKR